MSFAQGGAKAKAGVKAAVDALKNMIDAQWVDVGSRRKLKSFLQAASAAKEDADDDLSFDQPQAKMVAYESSSGGIVKTIEEMQGKAEDTLSDLRKKEMSDAQSFAMLESGLKDEIPHGRFHLSDQIRAWQNSGHHSSPSYEDQTECPRP